MSKFKCGGCGYIWDGDEAPDVCPKCGAPKEKFSRLDEAAARLVERSRHTNALHCRLVDLTRRMEAVCNDGIADKLDPGCVDVFTKALAHSYDIMKQAMTEMAIHVPKGKWG